MKKKIIVKSYLSNPIFSKRHYITGAAATGSSSDSMEAKAPLKERLEKNETRR